MDSQWVDRRANTDNQRLSHVPGRLTGLAGIKFKVPITLKIVGI